MTEHLVSNVEVTPKQQQQQQINETNKLYNELKGPFTSQVKDSPQSQGLPQGKEAQFQAGLYKDRDTISSSQLRESRERDTITTSQLRDRDSMQQRDRDTLAARDTMATLMGLNQGLGNMSLQSSEKIYGGTSGVTNSEKIYGGTVLSGGVEGEYERSGVVKTFKPALTTVTGLQTATIIDKKIIVEKVNQTHFETQYVTKTIPVPTPILNELTIVTGIQETKRFPVTKLVEVVEQVPIKVVEEVVEYKTIPVTRFEEIIEQVPVKKFVPRTEYKKVPVTKLVERTENVSVKRVEERVEYVTVTQTSPINPVPLDSFHESHSGIIQASSTLSTSTASAGITTGTAGISGGITNTGITTSGTTTTAGGTTTTTNLGGSGGTMSQKLQSGSVPTAPTTGGNLTTSRSMTK